MLTKSLFKATAIVSFFGLLSRFFGLYRDRVLASHFGSSDILDAYYVSFGLPDLIFNLLVVGSLAAAFIPKFIEYKTANPEKAFGLANNFLNILVILVSVGALVIIIFAEFLIHIIAPGFDEHRKYLAILFIRIMALSPVIFSVSLVFGSMLQSYKSFVSYSIAPVAYNLGIIAGAVWLVPVFGPLCLALGVVLGALFHLLTQVPELLKLGYRWKLSFDLRDSGVRQIFLRMIPRSVGLGAQQINWIFINAIATTFLVGGPAIVNLANNLQYLPIALVGISLAVASFPDMSELGLLEDKGPLWNVVKKNSLAALMLVIPVSIGCYLFAEQIVNIILGVGLFNLSDVAVTAHTLKLFMYGVPAATVTPLFVRAFYAVQNSIIPTTIGLLSIGINILFVYLFRGSLGFLSLPIGVAISANIQAILLSWMLALKLKK